MEIIGSLVLRIWFLLEVICLAFDELLNDNVSASDVKKTVSNSRDCGYDIWRTVAKFGSVLSDTMLDIDRSPLYAVLFWLFRWFVLVDVIRKVLFYWLGVFIFQYVQFAAILQLQKEAQRVVGKMELPHSPLYFCQWWKVSLGFQD
jgi:hypothetical protein